MKIGRNDPCPCGSGKKYKKCCLNNPTNNKIGVISNSPMYSGIASYHNEYIHQKEVKIPELNNKILNIYDKGDTLSIKKVIDDYLEVLNYVLDYAKENNLHTVEEIDDEHIVSDFFINIHGNFDNEVWNLDTEDYDFNLINDYLDKLIKTLELDDHFYENSLRLKTNNLFRLGEYKLGEQTMLDLIAEKGNSIYPYVELVDDFESIGDLKKAKYYYDLGMKQTALEDLDVLEEREDYFENL